MEFLENLYDSFKLIFIGFLILPIGFFVFMFFLSLFSETKPNDSLFSSNSSDIAISWPALLLSKLFNNNKIKKARILGYCFGYLYASNSGLNNTVAYKYVWDTAYDFGFSSSQINTFYKYFNKGKQRNLKEFDEIIKNNSKIWKKSNENISIFTTLIQLLFMDNLFSQAEQNLFHRFAKKFDIDKSNSSRIMQSFINKYQFRKAPDSEDYVSSFKFDQFDETGYQQSSYQNNYNNYQSKSNQYDSYSEENYFSKRSREQQERNQQKQSSYSSKPTDDKFETALLLLNITRDTPEKQAKKSYLKLMHTYHPDRAVGNKLPPEEVERYTELCQQIQAAWETVKEYKGW